MENRRLRKRAKLVEAPLRIQVREDSQDKYERFRAEERAKRLQIPLVERLRESGPFRASDGIMSISVPDYEDAHEAADVIENLEEVITRLEAAGQKMVDAYPDAVDDGSVEALTKAAIAYEQLRGVLADIRRRAQ